jgi:hypothetical protein
MKYFQVFSDLGGHLETLQWLGTAGLSQIIFSALVFAAFKLSACAGI